ncbi:MAG: hydrolase TatD [Flavobacteriales bacterium]|nr:hydrolase TatD [Flavobacteriales bacterium]|tara:strand:+ start:17924 stop:18655 length:732 start_codon:yes stop_codon:yes gene_type:complete
MAYHDTHFHLDLIQSPEKVAEEIENNRIYTIAVTNSPSVFFYTEKIASNKKYIRAALGLHPELAAERHKEVDMFLKLISKTKYIGEIGLDNSNKAPSDYQLQKKVFSQIINACADEGDKILTIHSRKASKDVIDIVGAKFPGKIILHWFSDNLKELERAIDFGYYFSINYNMIHSSNGRRIIDRIPIDRLLIETDGPFTKINGQLSTPISASLITEELVKYKNFRSEEFEKENLHENFIRLLK